MRARRRRVGVALVVDPPLSDEIDGLRRALGDPSLGRVPAHLTLVPPVNIREDDLGAALSVLRAGAGRQGGPLALDLGPVSSFEPDNPVVYLGVGGDIQRLRLLRDAVFVAPLARELSWPWVPHVTLADGVPPRRVPAALEALAHYAASAGFERVVMLEQLPGRVWEPVADAAFGPPAVVGRGGLELAITRGRIADPGILRMIEEEVQPVAGCGAWEGADAHRPPFHPIVLGARRNGELVGAAGALAEPGRARVWVLVRRSERRCGVGSHLLAHLEVALRRAAWPYRLADAEGPAGFYQARSAWAAPTRTRPPSTPPAS